MPTVKIPISPLFNSVDETSSADTTSDTIMNFYRDDINALRKRPGLGAFVDLLSSAKIDGVFWWDRKGILVAVSDGSIYTVTNSSGVFVKLSGVSLNAGRRVSFAENGTHLAMANGGKIVLYDGTTSPFFIADADAPTAVTHVAVINRRLLALQESSALVWYSDPADATAVNPLSFFIAESSPDDLVAMHVIGGQVVLFGKQSTEFFFDDGVTPFRRINSATLEIGCSAAFSVVKASDSLIWLDNDRQVRTIVGGQARIISSPFDDVIRDIAPVSDAEAAFISIGRRSFYLLTLPTANRTFAYDVSKDDWCEWGAWDSTTASYKEFSARVYVMAEKWDLHIMGSDTDGRLFKLDNDVFQDDSSAIRSLYRSGHISHGSTRRKRSTKLRIKVKRGLGDISGSDPQMQLRYKDDNGPWSNWLDQSLGKIGETEFFVEIRRLGIYRTRQFEFAYAENTDFVMSDIEEDFTFLAN